MNRKSANIPFSSTVMHTLSTIAGVMIVVLILLDAFETVVLPRRVARQHFRPSVWFYRNTWRPWARFASHIPSPSRREGFLGYFGPLSLIVLLGLWAAGLIFGFAFLQFGTGEHLQLSGEPITFGRLLYHSGETFFTLGYGDIVPNSPAGPLPGRARGRHGLRFSGDRDRISADHLFWRFRAAKWKSRGWTRGPDHLRRRPSY